MSTHQLYSFGTSHPTRTVRPIYAFGIRQYPIRVVVR